MKIFIKTCFAVIFLIILTIFTSNSYSVNAQSCGGITNACSPDPCGYNVVCGQKLTCVLTGVDAAGCSTSTCVCGSTGGSTNYSPTDYCGKNGMVTVCGPLGNISQNYGITWRCAPNLWNCRVRQPGALIGQGLCDGDPQNPVDCQTNCWCESLNPKGNFDSATCAQATGWACDSSQWNVPLFVNFYSDPGLTNYIGSTYANQNRPDVASSCGGYAAHGFNFSMPQIFNDGVAHNIYAVAQNIGTGSNTTLSGSPQVITCAPPPPPTAAAWWQVKDGDVSTNSDIKSAPPGANLFDLIGPGGYAGVPAYGGTTNLTSANVSTNKWLVNATIQNPKVFDYSYFANQIPSDTSIYNLPTNTLSQIDIGNNTTASYGYYWYKFDGTSSGLDLNLNSNLNIGSKKVILMVNSANFNINGTINLTKGQGFFMVMVSKDANGNKGNINVSSTIGGSGTPELEGIYEADNKFYTGTNGASTDTQLYIRGSVASYGGISLQRDLGGVPNLSSPAELLEFAPDQMMLFPSKLGERKINWKEVAP